MSVHDQLLYDFFEKAKNVCQPLYLTFEITMTCPLKCRHCYNFDRSEPKNIKNQLTREEILHTIPKLAEAGVLCLSFTGGEPLTHPNLQEFVEVARKNHFLIKIKTNGVLLDAERVKSLKKAGVNDFDLSLYGANDETYQRFCDIPYGFTKVEKALHHLIEEGFNPTVNLVLHRYNVSEFQAMVEFCQSLKVKFNTSLELTDRYDLTSSSDYLPTKEQYHELMTGKYAHLFLRENPEGHLQCPCAQSNCAISVVGDVYPCIGAPITAGNIRQQEFSDIWKNSKVLNDIRKIKNEDFNECFPCPDKKFCQRSSGSAYINTGNYLGKDPRTCEISQTRHSILSEIQEHGQVF